MIQILFRNQRAISNSCLNLFFGGQSLRTEFFASTKRDSLPDAQQMKRPILQNIRQQNQFEISSPRWDKQRYEFQNLILQHRRRDQSEEGVHDNRKNIEHSQCECDANLVLKT